MVKFTIMRILYGSNPFQISKDIKCEFNLGKLSYKHIVLIYASFMFHYKDEIDVLNLIKIVNKYSLNEKFQGIAVDNGYVGFNNTYYKINKKSIRFKDSNDKSREVEIRLLDSSKIDKIKSNNASCANLFHSIDAGVCLTVVDKFQLKAKFILTIHDAFIIDDVDSDFLIDEYNLALFNFNDKVLSLVDGCIDDMKIAKKDDNFINRTIESLRKRRIGYMSNESRILSSKFSLKRQYSTLGHSSRSMIKYKHIIIVPSIESDLTYYLNIVVADIEKLSNYVLVNTNVQIYTHYVKYLSGYRQKVTSKLYTLDRFQTCLQDFYGKLENYGADLAYIPLLQSIVFSSEKEDCIDRIKEVDDNLSLRLIDKPKHMTTKLWLKLSNINENKGLSESDGIRGMTKATRDKINARIKAENRAENKGEKSDTEKMIKYLKICDRLNLARAEGDKKRVNSLRTLADYHVKTHGLDKRH